MIKRLLATLLLLCASSFAAVTTITGSPISPTGALTSGKLVFALNQAGAVDSSTSRPIFNTLTTFYVRNGSVWGPNPSVQQPATLIANANILPSGTSYKLFEYDDAGTWLATYYVVVPTSSPFDLGTAQLTTVSSNQVAYATFVGINDSPVWTGTHTFTLRPTFNGGLNLGASQYIQGAGATAGITVKRGAASGTAYVTSSITYVDVDAARLSYTVTVPVGWKLSIVAEVNYYMNTAAVFAVLGLNIDGSTAIETSSTAPSIGSTIGENINLPFVLVGDGASHTIKLQFHTSNVADAMSIADGASNTPIMIFTLLPSN